MPSAVSRPLRADDGTTLATLLDGEDFGWSPRGVARFVELAASLGRVLESGRGMVGFAVGTVVDVEANLDLIVIGPDHRRQGWGRALLRDWLDHAATRGATTTWLEVKVGNTPALRLYQAEGFREVGRRAAYYRDGSDAVLMRR